MNSSPTPPNPSIEDRGTMVSMFLTQVQLSANAGFNPEKNAAPAKIDFGLAVSRFNEPAQQARRQVHLRVNLNKANESDEPPYLGQIEVIGDVAFLPESKSSDSDKDVIAAWTVSAALIGSARAYLDMFSALGPFDRRTFGVINIAQIIGGGMVSIADESGATEMRPLYPTVDSSPR